VDYINWKENVLAKFYLNWHGPIIWKRGRNKFTFGEWEFMIFYDNHEKSSSSEKEKIIVRDKKWNKVYEIEDFFNTF